MKPVLTSEQIHARVNELTAKIEPIQGWLSAGAGSAQYQLARLLAPSEVMVELGSWKGRSTAWLGFAVKDRGNGRVIAIDTWAGTPSESLHKELLKDYGKDQLFDEFNANMAQLGLSDVIEARRMSTQQAAREWIGGQCIGVLHIDAGHEYLDVRRDFEMWSPFVVPGGFIVFDDVPSWPGPTRLITELPRWFAHFGATPNQWVFRRVD